MRSLSLCTRGAQNFKETHEEERRGNNDRFKLNLSRFAADLSSITSGQYVFSGASRRSPSGLFPEL